MSCTDWASVNGLNAAHRCLTDYRRRKRIAGGTRTTGHMQSIIREGTARWAFQTFISLTGMHYNSDNCRTSGGMSTFGKRLSSASQSQISSSWCNAKTGKQMSGEEINYASIGCSDETEISTACSVCVCVHRDGICWICPHDYEVANMTVKAMQWWGK